MRPGTISIALLLAVLFVGCEETSPGGDDLDGEVSVPGDGAAPDPDALADAGLPDAAVPPVGVPHDFCGEDLFVLPIGGPTEDVHGITIWDGKVAYSRGPKGAMMIWDVYYLDLGTCLEYKLTTNAKAAFPYIKGSEIIWYDHRVFVPAPDFHCLDLYGYDLETWTETQLTDHPMGEWEVETNGRYVVYTRSIAEAGDSPREIILWDRQDDTKLQLEPAGSGVGYLDITDRYVAWSNYTQLAGSLGKDVFYYDLVTGVEEHVERSADYYCYDVRLWGDYLTYVCSEYWQMSPDHLFLHHIPTAEELHLDGADQHTAGITHGAIHDNVVIWGTSKHMDQVGAFETSFDIEAYDIRSGLYRRITTAPSRWRVQDVYLPYMTLIRSDYNGSYNYAVADLRGLGVIDADGNLAPGEGVLVPPE